MRRGSILLLHFSHANTPQGRADLLAVCGRVLFLVLSWTDLPVLGVGEKGGCPFMLFTPLSRGIFAAIGGPSLASEQNVSAIH